MWRRADSPHCLSEQRPRVGVALVLGGLVGMAVVADRIWPPPMERAAALSLDLRSVEGETLSLGLTRDGMFRLAAEPGEVSGAYLDLLLRTEDRRFAHHAGVDPLALARAAMQFFAHGRVVSGGSTLTMQVARLLAPHRHTLLGKLRDIARALQLERRYAKADILRLYLTLAPMGGNIEGVRAASLRYFGHAPDHLTREEAALLVALPQSPARRRPDRHPDVARDAAAKVLARAGDGGGVAIALPRALFRPRQAPHLATQFRHQNGPVTTTLRAPLQRDVEALAKRERAWFGAGADSAILVLRNADRAVLAYSGGSAFLTAPQGMVDMVRALRSPGSTLKPFIYGLGFEEGVLLPDTLVEDAPLRISDYAPQDFDRAFHGLVSAREALQQSYNLPAVTVLDWVGPERLAATLRQAGARLVLPGDAAATLPLALGGGGMSLWDLTALYADLADEGRVRAPYLRGTPAMADGRLMSAGAARQVLDVLRGAPRPLGVSGTEDRRVAYKTGTSYGFRDAWAIGCSSGYTVGIWVGRPDGTPRPGAFARGTAAPLLFRVFDLLPEEAAPAPLPPERAVPLAPGLRHLRRRGEHPAQAGPKIIYPPPNATLEWRPGLPLSLEAAGGTAPYHWTINGMPLPAAPTGMATAWQPDGPGFATLTLTDAADRSAQATVRVR